MRLEKASRKAIEFACKNYHYSKSVPVNPVAFSVFNDKNEWCGCILYGSGATNNIGKPYGIMQGQIIELTRMALNGKQESTSKALSLSMKVIKKKLPLVKLIISYADSEKGHNGIIYQATNWYYVGYSTDTNIIINGQRHHRRSLGSKYGTCSIEKLNKNGMNAISIKTLPKYKYIYPLDKSMIELCNKLKRSYPKKSVISIVNDAITIPSEEGGAVPTITHHG